ncbi:MAG: hypothetical protein PVH18_11485 [Chloroflexota bacterium]|jgi:hypothetical protein
MTSFACPECKANSLYIIHAITLPPDSRSDDIILQIVACRRCKFRGVAIYEESRRGGLDSESWDHRGYRIDAEEVDLLRQLIKACPETGNQRCTCLSHRLLGTKNEYGRWEPPFESDWQRSFAMRRS